jgi:hypothetical protein
MRALIIVVALLVGLSSAGAGTVYDRNGSFAGSSITRGNSTTFTDRNGRFDGTAIRNSDGTTSFYDKSGHFTGSRTNTTQPR